MNLYCYIAFLYHIDTSKTALGFVFAFHVHDGAFICEILWSLGISFLVATFYYLGNGK